MNKIFRTLTLAACTLALSTPAFAQKRKTAPATPAAQPAYAYTGSSSNKSVEIASSQILYGGLLGGGLNSALVISTASGSDVLFGMSAEGAFPLTGDWQLSVPLNLLVAGSTIFGIGAGPQYNFGDGPRMSQFFAAFRPGLIVVAGTAAFAMDATIGKRFEIIPGLAYRPNFGMGFDTGTESLTIRLAPIALSFEI